MKTTSTTLFFYLLAICTGTVVGDDLKKFDTGVNSLCIGHSFFAPIYEEMNTYVDLKTYPDHGFNKVFRGGTDGSPQSLWANDKEKIESYLESGNIDLLMMTIYEGTVLDDYAKWIDLARSYNLYTAIFIGIPWSKNGPLKTTSAYNAEIESFDEPSFAIVEELRDLYQDTPIYYLNYGHVAARMRVLFDQNALEDIQQLCCSTEDSVFRDTNPGHQGEMLRDITALFWLKFFYGDTSVTLPGYSTNAVDEIIAYAQTKNIGNNNQTLITKTMVMRTVTNVWASMYTRTFILVLIFLILCSRLFYLLLLKWKICSK